MVLEEEVPPGTEVGRVRARDEDEGENAAVDFAIVDGDDDGVFDVVPDPRGEKGVGVVLTRGRVDRERREEYLLTVRGEQKYVFFYKKMCFQLSYFVVLDQGFPPLREERKERQEALRQHGNRFEYENQFKIYKSIFFYSSNWTRCECACASPTWTTTPPASRSRPARART